MNKYIEQYTDRNKTLITIIANEKRPNNGWNPATTQELEKHNGNFALVLGEDDLIIDVDVKNGSKGEDSLWDLEEQLGVMFEKTVITPSGGHHIYLKKPSNIKTNKTLPDFPGIDFLRKGDICLIPGSKVLYKDGTEGVYTFNNEDNQFVQNDAPEALLNMLSTKGKAKPIIKKPAPANNNGSTVITVDTSNVSEYKKWDADKVRETLEYLIDEGGEYKNWITIGQALYSWDSEEGFAIWDEFSQKCDKYKPGETDEKWMTFSSDGVTLGTVVQMAKDNGYEPKERTATNNTPDIDTDGDTPPEWCHDWVRLSNTKQYFNKETRKIVSPEIFNTKNGKFVPAGKNGGKPNAVKYTDDNGYVEVVEGLSYVPFSNEPIVNLDGDVIANSYDPASKPTPANEYTEGGEKTVELVRQHIRHIFGDEERAVIFENWIAHQCQNAGRLLHWAPVIQSVPGLGKTYIARMLGCILGEKNVGAVGPSTIIDKYTGYATNKIVNVLEELKINNQNRHNVIDNLKPLITNTKIEIVEKFIARYDVRNTTNYLVLTNHQDALPLDKTDRRWWVTFCKIQSIEEFEDVVGRNQEDYFDDLFNLTEKHKDELAKFFTEYRITDEFKSTTRAPMTEEKAAMIATEEGTMDGLAEVKDIIESGTAPYVNIDVVSSSDLFKVFESEYPELANEIKTNKRNNILKRLGFIKLANGRKKIDKEVRTLWTTKPRDIDADKAVQILKEHNLDKKVVPLRPQRTLSINIG